MKLYALLLALLLSAPAAAGELTVRQVVGMLQTGRPAELAGRDLSRLDLSELDLSGADLRGANLFGANLTDAKLVRARMAGANLDRAIIIRADFSDADMPGVSIFLPAASTLLGENPAAEAPRFTRANLQGARMLGKIGNGDWAGANMAGVQAELGRVQFLAPNSTDLSGGRMQGADLHGAGLAGVRLSFADLRGANLQGADLRGADLAGAKLDGADLTGANLARADLQGASLQGALGLDRTFGLSTARNRPAMLP